MCTNVHAFITKCTIVQVICHTISTCAIWGNFAKALISENVNIAQKYEKLLLCNGFHILIDLYQSYKQLSKGKVLPLRWYQYVVWPMDYQWYQ